jgi:hypothetical protein
MTGQNPSALAMVESYYTSKVLAHGPTPAGVDWNGRESQVLRFRQFDRLLHGAGAAFSLDDYGSGYGAYFEYLTSSGFVVDYLGLDVSEEMVQQGRRLYGDRFHRGSESPRRADFAIASGIFNVRQDMPDQEWEAHLEQVLDLMHESSIQGFGFNCLTSYSDADKQRAYLYYADPCRWFAHCKRRFSRHVALLHDYGLYEFTIIVRA